MLCYELRSRQGVAIAACSQHADAAHIQRSHPGSVLFKDGVKLLSTMPVDKQEDELETAAMLREAYKNRAYPELDAWARMIETPKEDEDEADEDKSDETEEQSEEDEDAAVEE